ncbi:MAG: HD domain-containing protein [Candidatus Riflebacteria bacterium]|nr:HD domain-containing protein [Candidatus Riflebacteria bacterium]
MDIHPDLLAICRADRPSEPLCARLAQGTLPAPLPRLQGIPQPADKHPEGDVWNHTLQVADQAARLARREGLPPDETDLLVLTALVHDLGKITATTVGADGRVRSWRHEAPEVFLPLFAQLQETWPVSPAIAEKVATLVELHLPNARLQEEVPSSREVRRFLRRLDEAGVPFHLARWLVAADVSGRDRGEADPLAAWLPVIADLPGKAAARPACPITGRDLVALGVPPGPRFRELLALAADQAAQGWDHDRILTALRARMGPPPA